jgi:hypothetical protein
VLSSTSWEVRGNTGIGIGVIAAFNYFNAVTIPIYLVGLVAIIVLGILRRRRQF